MVLGIRTWRTPLKTDRENKHVHVLSVFEAALCWSAAHTHTRSSQKDGKLRVRLSFSHSGSLNAL